MVFNQLFGGPQANDYSSMLRPPQVDGGSIYDRAMGRVQSLLGTFGGHPSGQFPLNPGGPVMQPLGGQQAAHFQTAAAPYGASTGAQPNYVLPGMQNSLFRGY